MDSQENTAFLWTAAQGAVGVRSRDRDGEEPYAFDVFGAERQKVETLTSEWTTDEQPAPWNEAVARLYRAARRQALGVDRILEDLLREFRGSRRKPPRRPSARGAPTQARSRAEALSVPRAFVYPVGRHPSRTRASTRVA